LARSLLAGREPWTKTQERRGYGPQTFYPHLLKIDAKERKPGDFNNPVRITVSKKFGRRSMLEMRPGSFLFARLSVSDNIHYPTSH
jgi:hypothetical protein